MCCLVTEPRHSRPDKKDSGVHRIFGKMPGKQSTIDFLSCRMHVMIRIYMSSFLKFSLRVPCNFTINLLAGRSCDFERENASKVKCVYND